MISKRFIFLALLLANIAAFASPSDSVMFRVEIDDKYGFVKANGEILIEPQFDYAGQFSVNGLAKVEINGKYGYIDKTGKIVIEPQFELALDFHSENGLAPVTINGKWGFIDKTGKIVVEPQFIDCFYSQGVYNFLRKSVDDDQTGFLEDNTGKLTIVPYVIMTFFGDGLAAVSTKKGYGYIDLTGEIAIKPNSKYQFISCHYEGLAAVMPKNKWGKWGFIDKKGKVVIRPIYDHVYRFSNGKTTVVKNDKCGVINTKGEMIIKPQFDMIDKFAANGLAIVKINDKYGYIDTTGTIVFEPKFNKATAFSENNFACVKTDNKWGIIDNTGKWVMEPQFEGPYPPEFVGNYIIVANYTKKGTYRSDGVIDLTTGKYTIEATCGYKISPAFIDESEEDL